MKLYRVVSFAELNDLRQKNRFRGTHGYTAAKWFAESLEHAVIWGQWFTKISGIPHDHYIMIEVSETVADQFEPIGRRDGVGPARCATLEQLEGVTWAEVFP